MAASKVHHLLRPNLLISFKTQEKLSTLTRLFTARITSDDDDADDDATFYADNFIELLMAGGDEGEIKLRNASRFDAYEGH